MLFSNAPTMMHSIDASGNIVEVSEKWLLILGYSREEVLGKKSSSFLTEASRRFALETVLPVFFRTGVCADIPYQFVAKDGRVLDVLLSANSERNAQGEIVRSIAVMQEVTELKRTESELKAAKDYAENLLRTANAMVVELDINGNLRHLNPAAEQVTGYLREEIRGRNWFETLVPRARYPEAWLEFERLLRSDSLGEFENPILTKAGIEKRISWRNSQVLEGGKVIGTLSIGIDVTKQRAIEHRLKLSEAALKEAQSVAHIGSWVFDHQARELIWSDEIFRILEIDSNVAAASSDAFVARIHPEDRAEVKRVYRSSLVYQRPYEIRHRLLLPDGTTKYVHQRSETAADAAGKPIRSLGTIQDVTLAVLQEMAYLESEERFRTIADYTYDWEYWEGPAREILYISPSCQRVTGYSQAEFISDPTLTYQIIHPEDKHLFDKHLQEVESQSGGQLNFRIIRKDGEVRWIAHGCRAVQTRDGLPRGRRVSNRDISDLKNAEELASRLAHFDTLTGLPNRRMLHDRLLHAIAQARRHLRPLAVMFMDLDRFKQINDTLGHDVGDQLLVEVGKRLTRCVRECDTVSRAGGDEFIIVLPEIGAVDDACQVAKKFIATLCQPMRIGQHDLEVTASIGIAVRLADGVDDAAEMMKKADIAMYAAKRAGRNAYRLFDKGLASTGGAA